MIKSQKKEKELKAFEDKVHYVIRYYLKREREERIEKETRNLVPTVLHRF